MGEEENRDKGTLYTASSDSLIDTPEWQSEEDPHAKGDDLSSKRETNIKETMQAQTTSMRLCESRFDSVERLVAFLVMFHQMGKNVQEFWKFYWWLGLGYDMHRSQSA